MAIIGYARVSTTDQNLTAQLEALSFCDKIFQEKASASTANRPELQNLLEYVREFDSLVVCKLCRVSRNTADLLRLVELLEKKNVTFKVLNINLDTSTPTGKLMLTMLGAINQFERELLLERQREGIDLAKREGKYKGRKATARTKENQVKELLALGMKKTEVAKRLDIGIASVYRIIKSAA